MNTKISDAKFEECYKFIMEEKVPCSMYYTDCTDAITGTDFIAFATHHFFKGDKPETIFLYPMEQFLDSMYRIIESFKSNDNTDEYEICKNYVDVLSVVYQGLLERGVVLEPWPKPKSKEEIQKENIEATKMAYNYYEEMSTEKYTEILPKVYFRGNVLMDYKNKKILFKVRVTLWGGNYLASTNIKFLNDDGLIVKKEKFKDSLEELIILVYKYVVKNDGKFWYDDKE